MTMALLGRAPLIPVGCGLTVFLVVHSHASWALSWDHTYVRGVVPLMIKASFLSFPPSLRGVVQLILIIKALFLFH